MHFPEAERKVGWESLFRWKAFQCYYEEEAHGVEAEKSEL